MGPSSPPPAQPGPPVLPRHRDPLRLGPRRAVPGPPADGGPSPTAGVCWFRRVSDTAQSRRGTCPLPPERGPGRSGSWGVCCPQVEEEKRRKKEEAARKRQEQEVTSAHCGGGGGALDLGPCPLCLAGAHQAPVGICPIGSPMSSQGARGAACPHPLLPHPQGTSASVPGLPPLPPAPRHPVFSVRP